MVDYSIIEPAQILVIFSDTVSIQTMHVECVKYHKLDARCWFTVEVILAILPLNDRYSGIASGNCKIKNHKCLPTNSNCQPTTGPFVSLTRQLLLLFGIYSTYSRARRKIIFSNLILSLSIWSIQPTIPVF